MNEHVCEWARTLGGTIRCASCGDSMSQKDELRRLNATERLSARAARRISNRTLPHSEHEELQTYADILEGK